MAFYVDSFDHYDTTNATAKWTDLGAFPPTIVPLVGRCGSQAMRVSVFNSVTKGIPFGSATTIIGFAINLEFVSSFITFFGVGNGSTDHLQLRRTIDGALHVYRHDAASDVLLGSSAPDVLRDDVYYYVELKSTIHASTGAVTVRVNGSAVITVTGANTLSDAGALSVTKFTFYGSNNANFLIDDLYATDSTEAAPRNDFLGDTRIEYLRPTAAGDLQNWDLVGAANHYLAVDDAAAPDGDTSYISTATVNTVDLENYAATSLPSGSIFGVQVNILARKTDSGYRGVSPVVRHSGTDSVGTEQNPSHASYRYLHEMFPVNPVTVTDWTISDVNNVQVGAKVTT